MSRFENFNKYKRTFAAFENLAQEFTAKDFEVMREQYKVDNYVWSSYEIMSLSVLREHGFIVVTRKEYIRNNIYSYKGETIAANIYRKMPQDFQKMCEVIPDPDSSFSDKFVRNYYTVSWSRVRAYLDEYKKFCDYIEDNVLFALYTKFTLSDNCIKELRSAMKTAKNNFNHAIWDTEWRYWDNEINKTR